MCIKKGCSFIRRFVVQHSMINDYLLFIVIFRDPNQPDDVQQYINTTWTQYDPTFQRYIAIIPRMDNKSMRDRFSARAGPI